MERADSGELSPTLAEAYRQAVYEVDFANGQRRFRHRESTTPAPPFAIITAHNPGHSRPDEAENDASNRQLQRLLEEQGLCYVSARAFDANGSHHEPSFAVLGVDLDDALEIANAFGQFAIFWFNGRRGSVVFTRPKPAAAD